MRILITGCAGFVGFPLSNALLKNKKNYLIGIDNLNDYYSIKLKKKVIFSKEKKIQFLQIDISNYQKLEKIFKNESIDLIVNLAAQAGVRYSISNPKAYVNSNILGFFNLAELSKIYGIKKIYYASSSSVYGEKRNFFK